MEWNARYVLGIEPMDATHQEFVDLVAAMSQAENDTAIPLLERFVAHSEVHFGQENRWMEESGFPAFLCHVGEHQRVIAALREILGMAKKGDPGLARVVAREMEVWFEDHAATMDAALAGHLRRAHFCFETPDSDSLRRAASRSAA